MSKTTASKVKTLGALKNKKVAIVHDWLIAGGAERVVYQLHKMFPDAPIYTSYCTPDWRQRLDGKVITGYLQYWPFSMLRKFIPFLRINWFSKLDLSDYDLIISSSGAEAKFIKTPDNATHVAYIHAPTHYYWSRYDEYIKNPGFGQLNWLARLGLKLLVKPLRVRDYQAAQKPDYIIANSNHTKNAIKKYYERDSAVVWPPVDTKRFDKSDDHERVGFIVTGRQTPYKRIDLAVKACSELDLPLLVVGDGPEHKNLKAMAGENVRFTGFVDDSEVANLLAHSEGFIFAGLDDFGISPVEAMAAGTPVIAYKAGGALDYVTTKTGVFFEKQTTKSLIKALRHFDQQIFSAQDIKLHAEMFSNENFVKNIHTQLQNALK